MHFCFFIKFFVANGVHCFLHNFGNAYAKTRNPTQLVIHEISKLYQTIISNLRNFKNEISSQKDSSDTIPDRIVQFNGLRPICARKYLFEKYEFRWTIHSRIFFRLFFDIERMPTDSQHHPSSSFRIYQHAF